MAHDQWQTCAMAEAVEVNPRRPLAQGTTARHVEMAALPIEGSTIKTTTMREFTGGGARFQNGDTLFARITPCAENGKTGLVEHLPEETVGFGSTEFIVLGPKA